MLSSTVLSCAPSSNAWIATATSSPASGKTTASESVLRTPLDTLPAPPRHRGRSGRPGAPQLGAGGHRGPSAGGGAE